MEWLFTFGDSRQARPARDLFFVTGYPFLLDRAASYEVTMTQIEKADKGFSEEKDAQLVDHNV